MLIYSTPANVEDAFELALRDAQTFMKPDFLNSLLFVLMMTNDAATVQDSQAVAAVVEAFTSKHIVMTNPDPLDVIQYQIIEMAAMAYLTSSVSAPHNEEKMACLKRIIEQGSVDVDPTLCYCMNGKFMCHCCCKPPKRDRNGNIIRN